MKKVFMVFGLAMVSLTSYSQEILKHVDVMNDRVYWIDKPGQVFYGEDKQTGFRIDASFKLNQNSPIISGVQTLIVGMGCVENVEIIILFEDGSKITKYSWNKFNCDGNAWFLFTPRELDILSTKRISKIRLTNGFKYKSMTVDVTDPDYFINLAQKAANNEFTLSE
jgi:hypothetical protein